MDDYYSPHPRVQLDQAIAIAGQIGSGARMIGRCLSARTGLPFVDVDRQVEHDCVLLREPHVVEHRHAREVDRQGLGHRAVGTDDHVLDPVDEH